MMLREVTLTNGRKLEFCLRTHARVRSVRIALSDAGMAVTIPSGFDRSRLPAVLEEKREWIEQALLRYPMRPAPYRPPARVALAAIDREYAIEYAAEDARHVTLIRTGEQTLRVSGAIDRPGLVHTVLRKWLVMEGRRHLVPWLRRTAEELGYALNGASVRLQRTLWGSCSKRGTVSLNARLMLIPARLVRYVLVHELTHIAHHNHSRQFWQAVAVHEPDWRAKVKELKRLWPALPI